MPHHYGGCWMSESIAYTVFDAKIVFLKTYTFFLMVKVINPYGKNENEILDHFM